MLWAFFLLLFSGGGYLVTSPRLFRAGSTQELSVSLFFKGPWVINSTVRYRSGRGDIIVTDGALFTSDSDGTLKLKVSLILIYAVITCTCNHISFYDFRYQEI